MASQERTMAFVGCGTLGTAILAGILAALENDETTTHLNTRYVGLPVPNNYLATCRSETSAKRIRATMPNNKIEIIRNDNVTACAKSDIILLGCKPYMVSGVLGEAGMQDALAGKLLISICAGVSAEDLETALYGDVSSVELETSGRCRMLRAMPNTAAGIRESMTVIAEPTLALPGDMRELISFLFTCIGRVEWLPPNVMDASTALCGSGPAFFLLLLEAAIDGGVAMGLPRAAATAMAAQTMKGAAMTVLGDTFEGRDKGDKVHPAVLKDRVTTPGGCTIGGLMVLEEGGVRGTVALAVRTATVVASKLGQGAKNVNGSRA